LGYWPTGLSIGLSGYRLIGLLTIGLSGYSRSGYRVIDDRDIGLSADGPSLIGEFSPLCGP
jgi:hypothetical protein